MKAKPHRLGGACFTPFALTLALFIIPFRFSIAQNPPCTNQGKTCPYFIDLFDAKAPGARFGGFLNTASPAKHHFEGGARITVRGQGFTSDMAVAINDQPLTELIYYHPARMTGRVPPNPVGIYDLVLKDAMGVVLDILPGAIEYVAGKLPGPEDAAAVRLDNNNVRLAWSNLIRYQSMVVRRNGQTIQTLTGYPTQYVDTNAPYSPGFGNEYEVTGFAGGNVSEETTFFGFDFDPDCLEFLGKGASGRWDEPRSLLLHGNELQICFTLETDVNGLGLTALASRIRAGGELKARIRDGADPDTILIDGIAFEDLNIGDGMVYVKAVAGALLAGDYVLGLYAGGVFVGHPFAIARDESEENGSCYCPSGLRATCVTPHPIPPYPLVFFQPYCRGVPPQVVDITETVSVLQPGNPADDALWFERPVVLLEPALGFAPLEPRMLMLRADAVDDEGIVSYAWDFGGAGEQRGSDGDTVTFIYDEVGCYTVTVTVEDTDRLTASRSEEFCVEEFCSPPSVGSPPVIGVISPDPERPGHPSFIGGIPESPAQNYTVTICAAIDALIDSVTMEFHHPVSGALLTSVAAAAHPAGQQENWRAAMPFSDVDLLGLDSVTLRVVARDNQLQTGTEDFTIHLCPLPAFFDLGYIERDIRYDAGRNEYRLRGTIDPDPPMLDYPFSFFGDWDNVVNAELTHTQRLVRSGGTGRWRADDLRGSVELTVLDFDFGENSMPARDADDPGPLDCDDYHISYGSGRRGHIDIFEDEWEWDVGELVHACGCAGPLCACAFISMSFGASVDVDGHVDMALDAADPSVDVIFTLMPTFRGWNVTDFGVDVLFGLVRGTVSLRPSIEIDLPTTLTVEAPDFDLDLDVDDCFTFALDVKFTLCELCLPDILGGGCVNCDDTGWDPVWDANFSFSDSCPAGRGAAQRGAFPEPPPLKYPSIAVSPSGSRSMVVFVKNIATGQYGYDPEMYFSVDSGGGFSSPAPLFSPTDDFKQRDANVVFLSNTQALAVWTQGRLTYAQEAVLPRTPAGANTALKNSDIYYAVHNVSTGTWGAPTALSASSPALFADGRPAAAAIPNRPLPSAWVVWVRSDNEDMIDAGGTAILSGMSIFARKIENGAPSGAMVKLSAGDEANPACDIEPSIAVSPSGNTAIAVWVRDSDSNFDTSDDRFLMYSVNVGGAWLPAQTFTDPLTLPGVLTPSVALSSDDDGMVAFTVRDVDANGVPFGEGNKDLVYAIEIKNAVFQPAVPLQRPFHRRAGRVFGRDPIVRYLDNTNAAVVFRDFDGFGPRGGDGELAVATIDLAQPQPQWSFVRDLTDDEFRDWEIAAAVAPGGLIRTVRESSLGMTTGFDGLEFQDVDTAVTDMAIDRVRASNPYTPPGQPVELTAVIRNDGLRTPQTMTSALIHVGTVVNDVFQEVNVLPFQLIVPPDQTQTVVYTTFMPAAATRWRFIVQPIQPELDGTDNVADVILGVLPPVNLQCSDAAAGGDLVPDVGLTWENGEIYETVLLYRNGRLRAELDGRAESYQDIDVLPGDHQWAVRGRIGRAISDPAAAVCLHTVSSLGDCDADDDIDLDDFGQFDACLTGPGAGPIPSGCGCADFDFDGDVDLTDFAVWQRAFNVP